MKNTGSPLFSILVANYNNGSYFKDCFDSILSQTYQNWEVIIVDDCSTDNSVEIIKNIIGNDDRFKIYINQENKGCGYNKRRCAELATGDICAFVDPDDAITPEALQLNVQAHREYPEISMVYSDLNVCDGDLKLNQVFQGKQVENNDTHFFNLSSPIHHFATYKNDFYQKTEGIDPYLQRAVDQDLYIKMYESGPVKYINHALYNYRVHNNGISTFKNQDKAFYWHWLVINNAAKRRNINVENLFLENFFRIDRPHNELSQLRYKVDRMKKSKWAQLGAKLGLFKFFKEL
ncbi:glycosyltransferase family 2 protein [Chryseobacterium sp. CT-SW4]|uniref:glycosyltransferase family 2 protein n=1 Tax=Chryseobacterium sp. SW-1 TaxID=3157343 RepID=UPI003B0172CA